VATVVKMPQLGESVAEGTIGRWLKQVGDRVARDEPLVEIQTDKVNAEVPSPVGGFLQQILLPEGTTAAVKTDMAVIGDEPPSGDVAPPSEAQPAAQGPESSATIRSAAARPPAPTFSYNKEAAGGVVGHRGEEPAEAQPDGAASGKRFYTPVVLRMAEEHGIDLAKVQGTGTMGRVTRKDVERAIAAGGAAPPSPSGRGQGEGAAAAIAPPSPPAPLREGEAIAPPSPPAPLPKGEGSADEDRALTPMRRAIADHMSRARTEIPDAWSLVEVDVSRLVRYRASVLQDFLNREGFELTFLPFFIKAVLAGLRAVPELNATWAGDHITVHRQYHLGIAVSLQNGLIVPVLRDVDQLSIAGLARALRGLVQKARGGKLTLDDLQGATFTVNNPGSLGSIMSQPIVPVGQAGIVTMEAIVKRPVVTADDAIAVRSMMHSCLSFDHRVLDGAQALQFLRTIREQLETVEYPIY
jgi:2-oxoisovalerate dehydrogenase E2 component (dihydrolipoyl transacylase)